jgi:uncharacterized protein
MFIAICHDHVDPRARANRMTHLAAHLAYIESVLNQISVAGPIRNADGGIIGSVLIYKTASAEEAQRLFENDPYFAADIWSSTSLKPFSAVAGEWVGGKSW